MLYRKSLKRNDITFNVLNGIYPTSAIKKMSKAKLARLIYNLVQYTASIVGNKNKQNGLIRPIWWPNGIVFNNNVTLPNLIGQKELKATLEQLVKHCTQFFKTTEIDDYEERTVKIRTRNGPKSTPYRYLLSSINKEHIRKRQFLLNCGLQQHITLKHKKIKHINMITPKLMNTFSIPLSSDIGKLLIKNNNHQITDDLKLKRIEKTEWFINRTDTNQMNIDIVYPRSLYKPSNNYKHIYKIPKRQFHQQHRSLHDPEFLKSFCKPVYVSLERLDFNKIVKHDANKYENSSNINTSKLCDKRIPIVLLKDIKYIK